MNAMPEVFQYLATMLECKPEEIVRIHLQGKPYVEIVKGYETVEIDDDIAQVIDDWLEEYSG